MSTISFKEKNMLLIGLVVLLYGIAAFCYKTQMPAWKREQNRLKAAEKKLTDERALIAAHTQWAERYDEMREFMPVFPEDKDERTYWLRVIDEITTQEKLSTTQCQPSKEVEVGGVYELPIDCRGWEGSLDSLVAFLYELNMQENAMLDIRKLFIQTISTRPGVLKGTFTLTCAYMRGN